jgi:hypothetical protein
MRHTGPYGRSLGVLHHKNALPQGTLCGVPLRRRALPPRHEWTGLPSPISVWTIKVAYVVERVLVAFTLRIPKYTQVLA